MWFADAGGAQGLSNANITTYDFKSNLYYVPSGAQTPTKTPATLGDIYAVIGNPSFGNALNSNFTLLANSAASNRAIMSLPFGFTVSDDFNTCARAGLSGGNNSIGAYEVGTCSNVICQTGYSGSNCDQYSCFGVSSTDAGVCSGKGSCSKPDVCSCWNGYQGNTCSTKVATSTVPVSSGNKPTASSKKPNSSRVSLASTYPNLYISLTIQQIKVKLNDNWANLLISDKVNPNVYYKPDFSTNLIKTST